MLSITPALICVMNLRFSLNVINLLELYTFVNITKAIFSLLTISKHIHTSQPQYGVKLFPYRSPEPSKVKHNMSLKILNV